MTDKKKAAQLKEEGNALYVKQEYHAAAEKYSKALEYDSDNAVLYANRAACALGIKDYPHASVDAQKATEIDPTYAKAWARLATARAALGTIIESIECWNKALSTLPRTNLSPAQSRQKEQYEAELRKIRAQEHDAPAVGIVMKEGGKEAPWVRAKAMLPKLRSLGYAMVQSSAWVISAAYDDFAQGVELMKSIKKSPTPAGIMYSGPPGAIEALTNGIMRDSRAFHIADNNWLEMYNIQVMVNCQRFQAWTGDSSQVIAEALRRQRKKGWDDVRPAISTTVRAWIMRALIADKIQQKSDDALKFYDWILDVLQWGRRVWKSVPKDDRGSVFESTFVRGVRSLRLESLMEACSKNPRPDSKYTLEDLFEEAQDLIREIDIAMTNIPTVEYDPGFISSFYIYPRAHAYAMIGFYHNKMAKQCAELGVTSLGDVMIHFAEASKAYLTAATIFPEDDENHVWYLNCALDALYSCGTPIKILLPIMERVRLAIPKMKEIWEFSALAHQGRDSILQKVLWGEEDMRKGLADGKFTLEDKVMPDLQK
ncbi:hypothetical protein BKA93DRAFT_819814 [Sparassis latifolia]